MPAKLSSKRSVNYRVGSGRNVCGNCTMFKAPDACTAVDGTISPKALCNLFKAISETDDAWSEEAREAAAAARNVGRGLVVANRQQIVNAKRFPVGSQVHENRQGASEHEVTGHTGNMVHTTGGDFHHTKLARDGVTDAWSEEAREAAAEARRGQAHHEQRANEHEEAGAKHFRNAGWQMQSIKASGLHEAAATSFKQAAAAYTRGDELKGDEHMMRADLHAQRARDYEHAKHLSDEREDRPGAVTLHDTFLIDAFKRTRDGYLAVSAKSARSGIQIYKGRELGKPHMDNVRVYRPENQVFATDAMHSMAHRPVTLKHPPEMVDSSNWEKYAVGHTGDEVTRDGQTMRVPLVLMDAAAIDAVEKKGQRELSWGYTCNLDFTPGTTDSGEPYDAVQTTIRANHLAIVPMARAGSDFRIGDDTRNKEHTMKVIMIDGVPVSVEDDRDAATITKHITTLEKRCADQQAVIDKKKSDDDDWEEEDEKKTKDAKAVLDAKDGEIVALKKQLADSQAELAPAALDARLSTRQNVKDAATKIMGAASKAKFDGKTDAEIKRIVAASKLGDAAVKDMPDAAIDGVFTAYSSKAAPDSGTRPLADAFRHQVENVQVGDAQDPVALRDAALASRDKDRGDAWKHQPNNGQQRTQ